MSIRLRIALLVGLAVLGAAAFAAVDGWTARRTHQALAAQEGFGRLNDRAAGALSRSLTLQIHAEQFIREGAPRFAEAFHQDHARLAEILAGLAAIPEALGRTTEVEAVQEGVRDLGTDFAKLEASARHLGLTEEDGLRRKLRASVKAMEAELVMWPNAGPLMVAMLQMRRAEKDFMLYRTDEHLRNHARFAAQFDMALDSTSLPASTRDDFRALLAAYAGDMKAFGAETLALAGEVANLRQRQEGLKPRMEQLHDFAAEGMARAVASQQSARAEAALATVLIGILALASFMVAGSLIALGIVRPLKRIEDAMSNLAGGDHDAEIPCVQRSDEIGDMARALAVFRTNAAEMARMQAGMESVRRETEAASRGKVLALAAEFEGVVQSVAEMVSSKANTIHNTVGGIAGGDGDGGGNAWSLTIAEAAEQARHTVAAVTEATVQLTRSVDEVAANGAAVGEVAASAVAELALAEERVRGLAETAGRIERVVSLIGDIAQRTNMLSMNATIEASRAGDAGKGFAVVASEVKRLANQTAESAREIAAEISAIQAATGDTVAGIAGIGSAIRRMDDLAVRVQGSVVRQAEVTRIIERCVSDVAAETRTLSEGVAAFTHSAAQQCGAAAQVLWAAEDLAEPTRTLKDEVAGFLSTVRAA